MTIGERIAQIRKERGLSQEAFGESLGVTRQSISKWESNASIPDVDKLLAMNRLYGVSIGWILGEDTTQTKDGKELTEEQLRIAEKIAEKYIASIPQPKPKWKTWQKTLAIVGIIVLGIWSVNLYAQVSSLNNGYNNLANNLGMLQNNMNLQINSMASRVEEILEKQNHLLAAYETEIIGMDIAKETVTIAASVVPKSYIEGMTVEFLFESDGKLYTVTAAEGERNRFHCEYEFPYSDAINVSVVLHSAGVEQTQLVDYYDGVETSTKVTNWYSSCSHLWGSVSDIRETETLCVYLEQPEKGFLNGIVTTENVVWRVFINDEFVQEIPARLTKEDRSGLENEIIATGDLNYDLVRGLKAQDSIYIVTVVTDSYDRTYVVSIDGYKRDNENFINYDNSNQDYDDPKWLE